MPDTQVGSVLTDGTGASPITLKKLVKDFIADFLITLSSGFAVVNVGNLQDALAAPQVVAIAVGSAAIAAGYRILLRWSTS